MVYCKIYIHIETNIHKNEHTFGNGWKCLARWEAWITYQCRKKKGVHTRAHTDTHAYGENDLHVGFTLRAMRQIDFKRHIHTQVDLYEITLCIAHDTLWVSKWPYTLNGRLKINVLYSKVLSHVNVSVSLSPSLSLSLFRFRFRGIFDVELLRCCFIVVISFTI